MTTGDLFPRSTEEAFAKFAGTGEDAVRRLLAGGEHYPRWYEPTVREWLRRQEDLRRSKRDQMANTKATIAIIIAMASLIITVISLLHQ
jgi:hypothetical protein